MSRHNGDQIEQIEQSAESLGNRQIENTIMNWIDRCLEQQPAIHESNLLTEMIGVVYDLDRTLLQYRTV